MCPRGYFQNQARQGSCLKCPSGTFTREEGSKDITDCVPVCGYGTYSPTGLVPCLECPRNSYTGEPPVGGFKDCQACPVNAYTYQPAAPGRDKCRAKCAAGTYSPTGLAPCSQCPRNFYQNVVGQTNCMECPTNMKTVGTGATGLEECIPVECSNSACQHGGLCVPKGHGVQCYCPAGFSGRRCEIDIDECASQPCYNGGTCTDLPQGYRCSCPTGYGGINCQEERSDCRNDTCPERAMCKDEPGFNNYTCLCRSGYTGVDCDITVCFTSQLPKLRILIDIHFVTSILSFYRLIHAQLMETLAQTALLVLLYSKDATSANVCLVGKDSCAKSTLTIVLKNHVYLVQFART